MHVVQAIIKLWIGLCHLRRLIYLSGLVHNLNVVTVGVEYPGCVIVRMILELATSANSSTLPSRLRTFAIAPFGHSFLSLTICDGERWRAAHQREEAQRL